MSQEDLELATRAIRAATARPKPDFATMNEVFDPDHVFVPASRPIDTAEFSGGSGYRQFLQEEAGNIGAFNAPVAWEADVVGAIDVGNHKVVAVTAGRYRGTASGVEFAMRQWVVMTVRDGRICRTEIHTDPAEALNAALSAQDAPAGS